MQDVKNISNKTKSALTCSKSSPKYTSQQWKDPRCFKCNKHGHFAKNCSKKNNKENIDKKKLSVKEESDSSKQSTLLCNTLLLGEADTNEWYIDSGAHMIKCRDWMMDVNKPKDEYVIITEKHEFQLKVKAMCI